MLAVVHIIRVLLLLSKRSKRGPFFLLLQTCAMYGVCVCWHSSQVFLFILLFLPSTINLTRTSSSSTFALKVVDPADVPPTIYGGKHHLINCFNGHLYLVAAVKEDVPTLFVVEFLHRVFSIFTE